MLSEKITLENLTRQEQLVIWLMRADMSKADIAKATGATPTSVGKWMKADTLPPFRHDQLVKLGIPAALLPPAEYRTGGNAAAQ